VQALFSIVLSRSVLNLHHGQGTPASNV